MNDRPSSRERADFVFLALRARPIVAVAG